ncbi:efflux RND transporter permease subunit [Planctomycetota bacterium]
MDAKLPVDKSKMSSLDRIIWFFLSNKIIVLLLIIFALAGGILVAPFDWDLGDIKRQPIPVDAIPDIGENQQIVFTKWMGRSPQDMDDQISYPMTVALMGIPGVKTIRSLSMLGFSTIYVIFNEDVDFYWSRTRILEKLNSLPAGTLPPGVRPALGPDATALGQIFWYTIEGSDKEGNPRGGWDLSELRSIQDWNIRYALLSAQGVSEVGSVGGFVKEYQIDVDPDAMRAAHVKLEQVVMAVKMSNMDVGARTIEINKVEYIIRGVGFIKTLADIENAVIKVNDNIPIYVKDVAHVSLGPAVRRGALDKEGVEAVGGVVVVRYGDNPLAAIKNVKAKLDQIARRPDPGRPVWVMDAAHSDGTPGFVRIVPFYDRSGLIYETLGTLNTALSEEILVTVIVILVMMLHLRSSILISGMLPLTVLICFFAMKTFGVDANIVSLSGIAIAIGTIVDMGIIVCENIIKHLDRAEPEEKSIHVVFRATKEVGGAVVTAVATTVVSFLPVFTMVAAEGKLFKPLAFTKTFALLASILVALTILPALAHVLFAFRTKKQWILKGAFGAVIFIGIIAMFVLTWWVGLVIIALAGYRLAEDLIPEKGKRWTPLIMTGLVVLAVGIFLSRSWLPLGPEKGLSLNVLFVGLLVGGLLGFFYFFQRLYGRILAWCLNNKLLFLSVPLILVLAGGMIWLGFDAYFGWLPDGVKAWRPVSSVRHTFPGLGKEFMPPLDEGAYLFMPTTMTHASIGEATDILRKQDMAIGSIPEIESAVGKIGRADTPLDPAPVSMIETVINYKPEYILEEGRRATFAFDPDQVDFFRNTEGDKVPGPDGEPYRVKGTFLRDTQGRLEPRSGGKPFRLWRPALDPSLQENKDRQAWPGIRKSDDIWDIILETAAVPGTTSAPRLQPIAARIVMLQSGMRAPMGIKIKGDNLETIEKTGLQIEKLLKSGAVPAIEPSAVIADRIVGKPYLEINVKRKEIARHGIKLHMVQKLIETAIGGMTITSTVEGRERYPVRVRYKRELRDSIESLGRILVPAPTGAQIPLIQLTDIKYTRGPQVIKSEDTFMLGYVLFDKRPGFAEVDTVEQTQAFLKEQEEVFRQAYQTAMIQAGGKELDPSAIAALPGFNRMGTEYEFAGSYENQIRSQATLKLVLPLALFIIFIILYLQFKSIITTQLVFTGILVAWAGGFIMLWLYGRPWFLNFSFFGTNLRELFQVHPYNMSVAVWVGFLALFGIASDNGVVIATYLDQTFAKRKPKTREEIRSAAVEAGNRRVRPCLMTTATTILALIPILTSTGRGSDIMVPMALPSFGGMMLMVVYIFLVPVLYAMVQELKLKWLKPALNSEPPLEKPEEDHSKEGIPDPLPETPKHNDAPEEREDEDGGEITP